MSDIDFTPFLIWAEKVGEYRAPDMVKRFQAAVVAKKQAEQDARGQRIFKDDDAEVAK